MKALRKAADARMKQAIREAASLHNLLKNIHEGREPVERMADARRRLADLSQALHEASAYHSATATVAAASMEAL